MDMEALHAQIADEVRRIVAVVEVLTQRKSRWSGHIELVESADFKGKKPFRCDILLNAFLATQLERWSTLIHEVLHTVSAGYVRDDYQDFQGWEEGVIEQLQRLFRPSILSRLQINIDESIFLFIEEDHAYNKFIAALEQLRMTVGKDQEDFYILLLQTPIRDRPALMLNLGSHLQGSARRQFIVNFSAANAALRTRRPQGNLTP